MNLYNNVHYSKGENKPNTEVLSPLLFKMYGFDHSTRTQRVGNILALEPDILLQPSFKQLHYILVKKHGLLIISMIV